MSATELGEVRDKAIEALRAAEADGGASEATTSSVRDAHLAICMLKAGIAQMAS